MENDIITGIIPCWSGYKHIGYSMKFASTTLIFNMTDFYENIHEFALPKILASSGLTNIFLNFQRLSLESFSSFDIFVLKGCMYVGLTAINYMKKEHKMAALLDAIRNGSKPVEHVIFCERFKEYSSYIGDLSNKMYSYFSDIYHKNTKI
jgi:hypothetical protein